MPIVNIDGEWALENALNAPLAVVLKDSPRCIQCAAARRQLRKLDKQIAKHGRAVELHLLNVLEHRALSDRLASDFKVRHESPQAFVLRRGELIWHGDHFAVTWRKLFAALEIEGWS